MAGEDPSEGVRTLGLEARLGQAPRHGVAAGTPAPLGEGEADFGEGGAEGFVRASPSAGTTAGRSYEHDRLWWPELGDPTELLRDAAEKIYRWMGRPMGEIEARKFAVAERGSDRGSGRRAAGRARGLAGDRCGTCPPNVTERSRATMVQMSGADLIRCMFLISASTQGFALAGACDTRAQRARRRAPGSGSPTASTARWPGSPSTRICGPIPRSSSTALARS
jgi:hypothetical protein